MNRNKLFIGMTLLALFMLLGCRYGSGSNLPTPTTPPQVPPPATPAPTNTQAAQATVAPVQSTATPLPTVAATVTVAGASSQSDQIANQLKTLLDQLNSQLAGVNTLQDTPPGP